MGTPRLRDMVAPLLALPDSTPVHDRIAGLGVSVRRGQGSDSRPLRDFAEAHFTPVWADAAVLALGRQPPTVHVAVHGREIVGFAIFNGEYRGVFGPIGVRDDQRALGIGTALLLRCLQHLRADGFLYAVIGGVGPAEFYEKVCGAILLPAEWPNAFAVSD